MNNMWIYIPLVLAVCFWAIGEFMDRGDESKPMVSGSIIPKVISILCGFFAVGVFIVKLIYKVLQ